MFTMSVNEQLELALVQPSFAKDYFSIVSKQQDYLAKWLAWPCMAKDENFFEDFIKKSLHEYAEGSSMVCAMIFNGELVGNIGFNSISQSLKKVEVGYWLSEDFQGKGIVANALRYLIDFAFTSLNMDKVQISVATQNLPSQKVCERLGFAREGVISQQELLNGQIIDHIIYGLKK